jgi:hypothetical protein
MSKNCHGHADTFPQNENNSYGYADSKGLKNGLISLLNMSMYLLLVISI